MTRPTLGTYWRTARHLRWGQLAALVQRRVRGLSALPACKPVPVALRRTLPAFPEWQPPQALRMLETGEFSFLNVTHPVSANIPWSSPGLGKLWLYHLNYFDFLNADLRAPQYRFHLHRALDLARDWCAQNTRGTEVGWEPFPLSLRIVNWLKFMLRNAEPAEALGERKTLEALLASLRIQTLALEARLETHLLANHLLKNIKALVFSGALLDAPESSRWSGRGEKLLRRELEEQILADGGHIERSPMYHAQVLEDLLDIDALEYACGRTDTCELLSPHLSRMASFLGCVLHPDGEIPLFNDSALGMAPAAEGLLKRAGITIESPSDHRTGVFPAPLAHLPDRGGDLGARYQGKVEVSLLRETGYGVIRDASSKSCLVFDCGPLGPDYQPGHGHCDLLSYELSLRGRRVVVDTGVSTYEPCAERHYERSTAAHNTVRIDGEEQAEIWASFRVGRRPQLVRLEAGDIDQFHFVRGLHGAYLHRGVTHSRTIVLTPRKCWVVVDLLSGKGKHRAESFVHFHPEVRVEMLSPGSDIASRAGTSWAIRFGDNQYSLTTLGGGEVQSLQTWYAPEFGLRQLRTTLEWSWEGELPATLVYMMTPVGESSPDVKQSPGGRSIDIDRISIPL